MTGRLSRRQLVRSLMAGTAVLFHQTRAFGLEYGAGAGVPWGPGVADEPYYGLEDDQFFTLAERQAVDAITSRIIPSDDTGPGAREADVVTFIDRQLAGFYGRGQRWYMQGPFPEPLETQGYQSEHTPATLWRAGLAALDAHCQANFGDRSFADLSEVEQDDLLTRLDEEELELVGVPTKTFFDFAKEMTIEGFFADPIYGGNRDMAGWRYVGFPGARYDYRDYIHHNGIDLGMPPVSLLGRPGWNPQQ
jgi:gluconate 2-dehydrogenase gamma chain